MAEQNADSVPGPSLPVTLCWHCDRALDDASAIDDELAKPEPGAIMLCLYCGAIAEMGPDMRLLPATDELLDKLAENKEFRSTFVQFSWTRQRVMIRQRLMRGGGDDE